MRPQQCCPRGTASVLALIFMVILVAMAAGVGATVSASIQIARNEQAMQRAQAAAETGVEVMKSYLTQIRLPGTVADADAFDALNGQLTTLLPLNGSEATIVASKAVTIYVPQHTDTTGPTWVRLFPSPDLSAFRAVVRPDPVTPTNLLLQVTGTDGYSTTDGTVLISRTIFTDFQKKPVMGGHYGMFDYGVYSLGGIVASGGGAIAGPASIARMRSALPSGTSIKLSGSVSVAGKLYVAGSPSQVTFADNNINGQPRPYDSTLTQWETNNFVVEPPPTPPVFDPSVFRSLATNSYTPPRSNAGGTHANFVIPANSGTAANPLSISGNSSLTFQGIVYVESPNVIDFGGGPNTFNCVFVMANKHNDGTPAPPGSDKLTFSGNNVFGPIDTVNPDLATVHDATAGYSILAPTATVALTASSNALSQYVGSVIGWTVAMTGNSVFRIQDGSVISYAPNGTGASTPSCNITGSSGVIFSRSANYKPPTNGIGGGSEVGVIARCWVYNPSGGYSEGVVAP